MADKVVEFNRRQSIQQEQIDAALQQDPHFKFIHQLISAVHEVGLPLDKTPSAKAREIYAKYQRENVFADWPLETEVDKEL